MIRIVILMNLILALCFGNAFADTNKAEIAVGSRNKISNLPDTSEARDYFRAVKTKVLHSCYLYYTIKDKGEVTVHFDLLPDGTLLKSTIDFSDNSKNLKKLQNVVRRALNKCSPFPEFPQALGTKPVNFKIKIVFEDNENHF